MVKLTDYESTWIPNDQIRQEGKTYHYIPAPIAKATDAVIEAAREVDAYLTSEEISLEFDIDECSGDWGEGLKVMLKALDKLDELKDKESFSKVAEKAVKEYGEVIRKLKEIKET